MPSFKPPEPFNPASNPSEAWRKWRQQFQLYYEADDIQSKPVSQQRAILLVSMGEAGLDIYNTLPFTVDGDGRTVDVILNAFSVYFEPFRNITYRRYVFFSSKQATDQPVDNFVTELKKKAVDCDFGALTDSLVRDVLICGMHDSTLRERLLRERDLTLPLAVDICRADENSKLQNKSIAATGVQEIHAIKTKQPQCHNRNYNANKKDYKSNSSTNREEPPTEGSRKCKKCLKQHPYGKCPAYGQRCIKCGKYNHFAAACNNRKSGKNVYYLDNEEEPHETQELFLGSLCIHTTNEARGDWLEELYINNTSCVFKLDSGSHVNILPTYILDKMDPKPMLRESSKVVTSYSGHKLEIQGECEADCKAKTCAKRILFLVVDTKAPPILGLRAAEDLKLISRICSLNIQEEAQGLIEKYEDVFQGIGKLPGKHHITLKPDAIAKVHPARKIPVALQEKVKNELESMEKNQIIIKVQEPTEWVHPMVVVNKPNGSIRICLDPRELNEAIMREHMHLPTTEEIYSKIKNADYFTVLDASQAFYQIELDDESSRLCTFATPFGRYRFLRLPFGVKSSPEVFQGKINDVLQEKEDASSYFDDILVWGSEKTHNNNLAEVLSSCKENNLKLSKEKLQLAKKEVVFMGNQLTSKGVQIDPSKVDAITKMPRPICKQDLHRLLGMYNFLSKFIPNHSDKTEYLRKLLHQDTEWMWDSKADSELDGLKQAIISAPMLSYFDSAKKITLSVDASQMGLGAVMLQEGKPIAFASASLTQAQRNYAQIEKELLAVVFACEHYHYYIFGTEINIETDHKPLVTIVKKSLELLSPRIQRMVLRLMRYQYTLQYVPGKDLYIADTLSRAPTTRQIDTAYLEGEAETIHHLISATPEKMQEMENATRNDKALTSVHRYICEGWPDHIREVPPEVKPYWPHRAELHNRDTLIFRGHQWVVPVTLRVSVLDKLHCAHQGIVACKNRARQSVFWPHMSKDIEELIQNCTVCQTHMAANHKEPLLSHPVPERPWEKIGIDFMQLQGRHYLLAIDYHSKYVELQPLTSTSAGPVINSLKSIFARHGIPITIMSDNGPPFSSSEFESFVNSWEMEHITSSPGYPQSNGMAERAIQTVKSLMTKASEDNQDMYQVLLAYRSTPRNGLPSPSEMLMGRKLRTVIPTPTAVLKPNFDISKNITRLHHNQVYQKQYADRHAKPLSQMKSGERILYSQGIRDWKPGTIVKQHHTPRSYQIRADNGAEYRRNRSDIRPLKTTNLQKLPEPETSQPEVIPAPKSDPSPTLTSKQTVSPSLSQSEVNETPKRIRQTRSGRVIKTPRRLDY